MYFKNLNALYKSRSTLGAAVKGVNRFILILNCPKVKK